MFSCLLCYYPAKSFSFVSINWQGASLETRAVSSAKVRRSTKLRVAAIFLKIPHKRRYFWTKIFLSHLRRARCVWARLHRGLWWEQVHLPASWSRRSPTALLYSIIQCIVMAAIPIVITSKTSKKIHLPASWSRRSPTSRHHCRLSICRNSLLV